MFGWSALRGDVGHFLRATLWFIGHYFIAWPLGRLLFDFRSFGVGNVPVRGGVLAAANHVSYFDPPLLGNATPRVMYYMARADLFRNKFFSVLIRTWGAFPIRRDMWSAGGLKKALRKLDEGKFVLFFPEGTRARSEELGPPMVGAGLLAYLAKTPVIPVYIAGTDKLMPRGAKRPRAAAITVAFGPALDLTTERVQPANKETYRAIAGKIMDAVAAVRDDLAAC